MTNDFGIAFRFLYDTLYEQYDTTTRQNYGALGLA